MKVETVLKKLFAMYPNANSTPAMVLGYMERLSSIPVHELEIIVNQCIDESEFLPTVAKIKEMHRKMLSPVTPDMAQQGWESVQKAILGVGMWGVPSFKDPIVKRVVDSFGWMNLCLSENAMADRAQFVKFYEAFARQSADEQRLSQEYKQLRDMHHNNQVEDKTNGMYSGIVKRISG
jgi:hypothetical protein